jgi:RNA polymerase sigma-70 factor (ECF subfamily)
VNPASVDSNVAHPPDDNQTPDAEHGETAIVEALAAGHLRRATELCAERYGNALGRLCMALVGSQQDAEELAQDTLLSAHRAWSSYRRDGSVKSWLFGIARKKCLQHATKQGRRQRLLRIVSPLPNQESADDRLLQQQRGQVARAALDEIRPTEREALLLRYVGELSFAEVAAASDVEPATARKRVSRGLSRLRSLLNPQEHP